MDRKNTNRKHHLCHIKLPFPFKLHEMLSDAVKDGTEDIVSWQPHGMAFRVHKPKEFTESVMKRYFYQTHYKSFQRQLHIYGFRRISTGLDKGSYHHPMFVKGDERASLRMIRCKIKGSLAEVQVADPDFYHQVEPVGSVVVNVACPEQERSNHTGLQAGSISTLFVSTGPSDTVSNRSYVETLLSKAVTLPTLPFSRTRLSQESQEEPIRRHNVSCGSVTPNKHTMMLRDEIPYMTFGGNASQIMTTMMLQDDVQPLSWNRIAPNRRMSLFEEGDEAFFAGKKFFFVEKPFSLPTLPTRRVRSSKRHSAVAQKSAV